VPVIVPVPVVIVVAVVVPVVVAVAVADHFSRPHYNEVKNDHTSVGTHEHGQLAEQLFGGVAQVL
jgi:hypothetical protein